MCIATWLKLRGHRRYRQKNDRKSWSSERELYLFEGLCKKPLFQKAALEGVPVHAVKDSYSEIAWQCYVDVAKEIVNDQGE